MTEQIIEMAIATALPIIDIICTSASPLLLLIIAFLGRAYLIKRDIKTGETVEKQERRFRELLARQIKVEQICNKTADKLDVNQTKEESSRRLIKSKNYYVSKFSKSSMKSLIGEIADSFTTTYSDIVNTYKINIDNINGINQSLETFISKSKQLLHKNYNELSELINEKLDIYYEFLTFNVEDVLTSPENHYEKKFEVACYLFLKSLLKDLLDDEEFVASQVELEEDDIILAPQRKHNRHVKQDKSAKKRGRK